MPTPEAVGQVDIVLSFPVSGTLLADRLTEWYNIVGKLEQGVTLAQAQAALDLVAADDPRVARKRSQLGVLHPRCPADR